jgi:hypothetical protein
MIPDGYWDDRQQSLISSERKLIKSGGRIMLGGSTYTGPQGQLNWTINQLIQHKGAFVNESLFISKARS